jgi:hypothetical protein
MESLGTTDVASSVKFEANNPSFIIDANPRNKAPKLHGIQSTR